MTASAPARVSPFSVFRHRNFTLLWLAQLVSNMGTSLTSLAAAIYVYELTGSALNVGLMLMASAAPSLLVGLVAGVVVDRMDRRRIMLLADILRALLVLAIPFLLPFSVAWLYVLILLTAAVGQFFEPAHASVLPELATEEELTAANSMMAISSFGALVVGFALAGVITGNYPIEWAFYFDAATFFVSAICIFLARLPRLAVDGRTTAAAVWRNLTTGIRTIATVPILRSLFLVFLPVFLVFGFHNALRLPFAMDELQLSETQYGLLEAVGLAGLILGSLLTALYGDRLREGQWLVLCFIGMGLASVVFGLLDSFGPALVVLAISGFLNAPTIVARSLVIRRNTPREQRGRLFSAFFVTRDTEFMVGMALAGIADFVPIRPLFIASGLLIVATGVVALVLPGLGQVSVEWRRALSLLQGAPLAPGLAAGRPARLQDFDRLIAHQPALASVDMKLRKRLVRRMQVREAAAGTAIMRIGDQSDAAYFILQGRAVAGAEENGSYRILEILNPGDLFGEIAALTGVPRTATVVADTDTLLLEAPAAALREIAAYPTLNRLVISQMASRMARSNLLDVSLLGGGDQNTLLDLRRPVPDTA